MENAFEQWLAQAAPEAQHPVARAVHAFVLDNIPQATVRWVYGIPFYYHQGKRFAYLNADRKKGLLLGLVRGVELSDPQGLLSGAGKQVRHVLLSADYQPDLALRSLLEEAAANCLVGREPKPPRH